MKETSENKQDSKLIVYQRPNATLIVSGISLAGAAITSGLLHTLAVICFVVVGTIWSYEELVRGASIVRRLFGVVGLLFTVIYLYQQMPSL